MVNVIIGDIFESKAQTLVNTVNTVGVMGKGVSLGFKRRFPDMYEDYVRRCKDGLVKLGEPYLYRRLIPPWILNFPTKEHWRSVSRLRDIVKGMDYLEQHYREWGIVSLAVPPLGCGEGQLEWRVVGPTLYRYLTRLSIPVELYAPYETPHDELQTTFLDQSAGEARRNVPSESRSRIEPAWVALVEILSRLEQEPYHWPVGRVAFQKIGYFATQSGISTGLRYRRGSFGPYAPEVKRLIGRLVNNSLIGEALHGRMLAVSVGPTFRDARKAYERELAIWQGATEKVADLFMRMNTQQAEVAATVHFAAESLAEEKHEKPSESEVLTEVMGWKQKRRPRLSETEVALSIRNLTALGWLDILPSRDLPIPEEALLEA